MGALIEAVVTAVLLSLWFTGMGIAVFAVAGILVAGLEKTNDSTDRNEVRDNEPEADWGTSSV